MKRFLIAIISLFATLPLLADDHPNGLIADSLDPEADAAFIQKVRKHLDKVRQEQGRPTVALVLGGGGAKGAAEISAMRVIDSLKIPIDFVCGTSIGSLVGGVYAVGYDINFIDSLICNMDWSKMMSDKIDQYFYPLHEKKYRFRYAVSMPFSYDSEGLHADLLPSGYVNGQNIRNFFSSLTVGYHDSMDFADLPVPFACVSAEVVQQKAKYNNSGVLKTAMRSSMSIPGVFTPVVEDGLVLVDGGIRNNFPSDIARAVGADIIIGIDIQGDVKGYDDVNNIATVLQQLVSMLTKANLPELNGMADIFIKPDIEGFTALSFSTEAISELRNRGYAAAMEKLPHLEVLADLTNRSSTSYQNKRAVDINTHPVHIKSIMFTGMTNEESRLMHQLTRLDITKRISGPEIERAIDIVKASGNVHSVTYSLLGDSEPYDLVFDCRRSQPHKLGVGVRMDSEVWAEIGLNLGINVHKIAGPKFDIDLKLGQSQSLGAKVILDYPEIPTLNFETKISNILGVIEPLGHERTLKMQTAYLSQMERLYLSSRKFRAFEVMAGLQHNYYTMGSGRAGAIFSSLPEELMSGSYLGAFARMESYTLDDMYFPTRGVDFLLGGNMDFHKGGCRDFQPKYYANMDFKFAIPFGSRVALIPDFHYRILFDRDIKVLNPDGTVNLGYSYYHRNFIGGDIKGRYLEHQIPFIGFNNATDCIDLAYDEEGNIIGSVAYDNVGVVNLDLRTQVGKKWYLSVLGGYAHMAPTIKDFALYSNYRDIRSGGIQISYGAVTGPIKFRVQWSDREDNKLGRVSGYFSAGFNF